MTILSLEVLAQLREKAASWDRAQAEAGKMQPSADDVARACWPKNQFGVLASIAHPERVLGEVSAAIESERLRAAVEREGMRRALEEAIGAISKSYELSGFSFLPQAERDAIAALAASPASALDPLIDLIRRGMDEVAYLHQALAMLGAKP